MKTFVWFDLGYTLLYLNRENAYRQALSEAGIELSLDRIDRGFHFADKLFMREYPGLFGVEEPGVYMPWFIGRMNYELGIHLDINKIMSRWIEIRNTQPRQWEAYSYCRPVLSELKDAGYKLGVISNWDNSARKLIDDFGLTQFFDTIVISSEVGVSKPSPEIFDIAFEESGSSPADGLYVGDNYYDDAVGSRSVGMDCCIINRFGNFGVEELKGCGIIPDIRGVKSFLEWMK
ncbi:MAG: HAD family hydrolase [Spirochaetales bacterium]|uniref:HAD family hydrolase n=1 Tax=Candidatus Thalassospirochaeta sargassi TaxID=3119039 RepID=A0AAJ1IDE9_9SPIO|nr:HAD family hydrolase [Spirochaetales bacterium]